jgi:hypothetical protein
VLIFVDESGDAGFKTKKGSTQFFVIALVIFDDELEAERTALTIKDHRRSQKKSDRYEFKFNKCKERNVIAFLKAIRSCNFRVRVIVVDKNLITSPHLISNTSSFYNFILKQVLQHNNNTIRNAKIRLDGLGERKFRNAMTRYLKKELNTKIKDKLMRNFKFRDSKSDVLIQLADMIAGSIRRSYEKDKTDSQKYKKLIQDKIEDEWEFK